MQGLAGSAGNRRVGLLISGSWVRVPPGPPTASMVCGYRPNHSQWRRSCTGDGGKATRTKLSGQLHLGREAALLRYQTQRSGGKRAHLASTAITLVASCIVVLGNLGQHPFYGLPKRSDVALDEVPNEFHIDAEVRVRQTVAHRGHVCPRHCGIRLPDFSGTLLAASPMTCNRRATAS